MIWLSHHFPPGVVPPIDQPQSTYVIIAIVRNAALFERFLLTRHCYSLCYFLICLATLQQLRIFQTKYVQGVCCCLPALCTSVLYSDSWPLPPCGQFILPAVALAVSVNWSLFGSRQWRFDFIIMMASEELTAERDRLFLEYNWQALMAFALVCF